MLSENIMIIAILLSVAGNGYYAYAAYKGAIQPNVISWFLWGLAPLIMFFAQRSEGSGIQSMFSLVTGLMPFVVLAAARIGSRLRFAVGRIDIVCALVSVTALMAWFITGEGAVAIWLSILAGSFASLPTLLKGYRQPETERSAPFVAGVAAAVITLLTVPEFSFETAAFPLYVITSNTLLAAMIMRPNGTTWPQGSRLDVRDSSSEERQAS